MPLKNNKQQRINATAAPAAMKGSARAGVVIAAPVNAEERLLKVCVRRTPLERAWRRIKIVLQINKPFARHYLPAVQDETCTIL